MARTTLILAKNITQANRYARAAGLQRFSYRAVRNASAIRGVRNAEVHILPDFVERFDRHPILKALENARTLEVFYVDPADFAVDTEPAPMTPEDRVAGMQALADLLPPDDDPFACVRKIEPNDDGTVTFKLEGQIPERDYNFSQDQVAATEPTAEKPDWVKELEASGAIEPDGFELSEDPTEQAEQIIESAAHFAEEQIETHKTSIEAQHLIAEPSMATVMVALDSASPKRRSRCKECDQLHFKDEACAIDPTPAAPSADNFFS